MFPIPEKLADLILNETHGSGPTPEKDDVECCFHCGMCGHRARVCPVGGSWKRNMQGRMFKKGGRPRCFVCARNATHSSKDCPYRSENSWIRNF